MKTLKLPVAYIAILTVALALSACGKTKRASTGSASAPIGGSAPVVITPTPIEPEPTPTTPTAAGAPISFEFTRKGNEAVMTGDINTDNVLKVKFRVTHDQGSLFHQATELSVVIAVNGTEVNPTYTANGYYYGRVNEVSNVIDLSDYITPGTPVRILVKNPKNDFYCTYIHYNPLYNQYPGCRKAVHSSHNWGGVLTVQTSSTRAI